MVSGEKIRVLIVDDVAETRENIRKLLQFENDVEVVGAARTGREGIDLAKETKPDVILMDINMPDMDGISATEAIRKTVPFTQIIILSVQGDSSYMRRAMLVGARDYLTKPPPIDELTSAIRRAGRLAHDERAAAPARTPTTGPGITVASPVSYGRLVVVYSPKGGVGCTTIATNLAVVLHNEETPVVLVDADFHYGDVAVFLNEQGKNSVADLTPRADDLDPEIVEDVLITHQRSGVKVLAAPSHPEYAEDISGEQFAKVLQYLRRLYSYVVVDTSSSLSDPVLAAIDACDLVILLTSQEIPAIKDARIFFELSNALEINRKRIIFVMNKFDKRIGITPEKVSESFKHEISTVIPSDERLVIPSINRGMPFMIGERSRPISKAMLTLAENVRQRLSELATLDTEDNKIYVTQMKQMAKRL